MTSPLSTLRSCTPSRQCSSSSFNDDRTGTLRSNAIRSAFTDSTTWFGTIWVCSLIRLVVRCLSQRCKILVHKLNCDGAFTNSGGAPFDRVESYIACNKDARNARLQQVGVALQ